MKNTEERVWMQVKLDGIEHLAVQLQAHFNLNDKQYYPGSWLVKKPDDIYSTAMTDEEFQKKKLN